MGIRIYLNRKGDIKMKRIKKSRYHDSGGRSRGRNCVGTLREKSKNAAHVPEQF